MERLMTTTTLGLALAVTPVLADEIPNPNTADTQSTGSNSMNKDNVRKPGEFAAEDKQVEFLKKAPSDQFAANKLIRLQVYDRQNKQVGEIDDLVLARDGKIDAAVIGVGRFMGLDEKQVAVTYGALNTRRTGENELKVTLDVTKEKLESAPAFSWSDQVFSNDRVFSNDNASMTQTVDRKEGSSIDTASVIEKIKKSLG
jgi:sporulation protein YlmC with PRC-barrel domain